MIIEMDQISDVHHWSA